ncbi:SCO3242 family prenyltransferase [Amycolatopsis sp. CA-230715]|uniref:SCO3242 family prenyltransferase n=1 Tax=Amycolatopsis sp. CA-230715 TaxID=2745196 RepID=UPI001C32C71B|nr:UbiA family prenyltransferase [Amycolatopsis sp. CA-230715]QWF83379.1 Protoheme IX farnesyltransferase [Amycolatopsis sp. CA-230715]
MNARAFVELVRAPAALTVLGDTVAGAAAAGEPLRRKRLLLPLASASFYWAGMALNDWADRGIDAVERPERPIPSGRVSPGTALGVASGLTLAGLGIATAADGRRGLRAAVPVAGAVWAYDTWLKRTAAAPLAMAACRAFDVLMGGRARLAAATVGLHTLGVTALSAGEVHGGSRAVARASVAGTAVSAGLAVSGEAKPAHRAAAAGFAASFLATAGKPQLDAATKPSARLVRKATVGGIHGMVPLQAALAARHGAVRSAALLAGVLPLAGKLARKVSPT